MIGFSTKAAAQVASLRAYYLEKARLQAGRNLSQALAQASLIIMNVPHRGLPAPRPYPFLAREGEKWLKCGRYWIVYSEHPPVILGVFFETDDIPNRLG